MSKYNDLISVIVPVYNAESSIVDCIDGILKQSYVNFELILVNDGSRDSSKRICEEYEKKDTRIRLINKENGGASTARNIGLDSARGEYIVFQDSDDVMMNNALEILYSNLITEDADMCVGSICISTNKGKPKDYLLPIPQDVYVTDEREYWKYCFVNYTAMVPWAKIFKKAVWKDVRYNENAKIHEDEQVLQFILPRCKKIVMLKELVVLQNIVNTSMMNQKFSLNNLLKCEFMIGRFEYFYRKKYSEYYMTTFGEGSRVLLDGRYKLDYKSDQEVKSRINLLYKQLKKICSLILKEPISLTSRIRLLLFKTNLCMYGKVRKILR